ncbi:hypothetical protein IAD21_00658 [Abditibacteriota bacterium]|nr:hypothetical protein IAD21_00658 [Abditibacteriota bacterium]
MTISLMQEVLLFLRVFAPASLLGALSYAAMMLTRGKAQHVFLVISLFIVMLPLALASYVTIPAIASIALLCLLPASLERRLDRNQFEWQWYFLRMIAATYTSVIIGFSAAFIEGSVINNFSQTIANAPPGRQVWPDWIPLAALCAGFVLTPASISVIRWMVHSAKLRPGHDRPLHPEETLS